MNCNRVMVIVNPISGTRSKDGIEQYVENLFKSRGVDYLLNYTRGPEDARRLATEAANMGYSMVIAIGGDGTINEVASALIGSQTVLGIIPSGSGNGLARTLQIPQSAEGAMEVVLGGNVVDCDCGIVNGHPFFCTFGLGFDAAVAQKFASSHRRGKLTYLKNAIVEYLKYRPAPYALMINGEVVVKDAFLIAVCNVSQYGNNLYIAPSASIDDGLLDITLIRDGSPVDTAMAGLGMLAGALGPNRTIESFRISSAVITRLQSGLVQIDGEPMEMGCRLEIECRKAALKVIAPLHRHKFRPFVSPVQSFFSDLGDDIRHIISGR